MPTAPPKKLDCYDFGLELIRTGDLDPVYITVWNAKLEPEELNQWLLAYWCFYHCGTASYLTGGDRFYWAQMNMAAASKDYPRGRERRHFRGDLSIKSVDWLVKKGLPEIFRPLTGGRRYLGEVICYVCTWYGFGEWIAFKVADMVDRLGLTQVDFSSASKYLYESPRQGAEKLRVFHGDLGAGGFEGVTQWALDRVVTELGSLDAPPRNERKIGYAEAETILCKWDAYLNGHYHIGEDIVAVRKALLRFSKCDLSQRLLAGSRGVLW